MTRSYRRGAWRPFRHSVRLLALAAVLPLSTACSDTAAGPNEPAEATINGEYDLADVGGQRLPVALYEGPYQTGGKTYHMRIDVGGGVLELERDRYTFMVALMVSLEGQAQPVPIVDEGRFSRNGDRLTFTSDDPEVGTFSGSITRTGIGVSIDLVGDGRPPVYQFRK